MRRLLRLLRLVRNALARNADLASVGINATEAPRGNTPGPPSFLWNAIRLGIPALRSALTPLELAAIVVVTGIVGTLASVAHRTNSVRSEVSEGVALAALIAPLIADAVRRTGGVPPELSAAIPAALREPLLASVVRSVTIVDGRIDVVFSDAADSAIAGRRVSLTPYETIDLDVVWVCGNKAPGPGLYPLGLASGARQATQLLSTIEPRYLTDDCR